MSGAQTIAAPLAPRRTRVASVKRALAMLLLPASIIPVFFLGPTLLRAPRHLYAMSAADIHRVIWPLEHRRAIPPSLAPIDGPRESPAVRRGGTVELPAKRIPR